MKKCSSIAKTCTVIIQFLFTIAVFAQNSNYKNLTKGTFNSYESKTGVVFNVGDQIELGIPSSDFGFTFISQGGQRVSSSLAGNMVTILKLKTYGSKKRGYKMYAHFKGYGMVPVLIDLEMAQRTKEIIIE